MADCILRFALSLPQVSIDQAWALFVFLASEILLVYFMREGLATMRLVSRDRTMVSLDPPNPRWDSPLFRWAGHVWLFNSRLEITGSVYPPPGHINTRTTGLPVPDAQIFSIRTYASEVR